MSATKSPSLRLLSLNVNGLRGEWKRRMLFHKLQQGNYDIVCLQETHHSCEAEAKQWMQAGSGAGSAWLGASHWCHFTTSSRGVAILFSANIPFTNIHRIGNDPEGRVLRVDFTYNDTPFTVATIYAPSTAADRPRFFSQLHTQIAVATHPPPSRASTSRASPPRDSTSQPVGRCLLVGGDFNCVADRALDRLTSTAAAAARTTDQGFPELHSCMQLLSLTDSWRHRHPTERAFTYVNTDTGGAARLDRWLSCTSTQASITSHGFVTDLPGDHVGVLLRVTPANGVIQGKGSWSLKPSLIPNPDFSSRLRSRLGAFKHRYPLSATASSTLFLTALSHPPPPAAAPPPAAPSTSQPPPPPPLPPHPHAEPLNARDRLDGLIDVIYTTAVSFELELRHSRRREQAALQKAVNAAATAAKAIPMPANALHDFKAARQALQEHGQQEVRNAAARAAVVYQDFAEAPTFYFHATHGRGEPQNCLLTSLQTPDQIISLTSHAGRLAAAAAIEEFYSSDHPGGLFRPGDVNAAVQDELLADIDRTLSPADKARCEGVFTVEELYAALCTLPRGKAPGSDGIPYELYTAFWEDLGQPLCDALNEAFAHSADLLGAPPSGAASPSPSRAIDSPTLTKRQRTGTITIIYKGKGSAAELGNYRPITLFNADVKIAAKALALRFSHPLASVIDSTQTAYIPGRWAGDNVICHMEEVDYAAATGEPGALVFLDFAKAFDRLHRGWLLRSLDTLGFGPDACCWVTTMLAGSQARVAFNGWMTANFPTAGGVGQGSPLSALLYVAAAQPMAARARHLQAAGLAAAIAMPDGSPAPPTHQHADDTTLHARTVADVAVLFHRAVMPFCNASGAKINVKKTKGITFGEGASMDAFTDAATAIEYVGATSTVRHLGIEIGADAAATAAARDQRLNAKLGIISSRIATWSRHNLSYLGKVYVARQVLASILAYHFTFLQPKPATLRAIQSAIFSYVKRTTSGSPQFYPAASIATLPFRDGGVRLPDLLCAPAALRAKYASRMLEPAHHPWKVYAASWLGRDAAWLAAHPHVAARDVDAWGLGTAALVSTFDCATVSGIPARVRAAFTAFQHLHPHRLQPPTDLSGPQVQREPLFFNRQITDATGQPLSGPRWATLAAAGIQRVGDLHAIIASGAPTPTLSLAQEAHSLLPPPWRSPQLPPATIDARLSPDHTRVVIITPAAQGPRTHPTQVVYIVNADHSLVNVSGVHVQGNQPAAQPPPDATWSPCLLSRWSPATTKPTSAVAKLYLVAPWASAQIDPALWGCGTASISQLVVSQMSQRLRVINLISKPPNSAPYLTGHPVRPKVWEDDWDSAQPGSRGIRHEEQRWADSAAAKVSAGLFDSPMQDGTSLETASTHAPWMNPPPPRLHPRERAAAAIVARQAADDPPPPTRRAPPPTTPTADDTVDIARPTKDKPPWASIYKIIGDRSLPREHRIIQWRLLHGFIPCGAFLMHVNTRPTRATNKASKCSHPGCNSAPANLSHIFITCQLAQALVGWLCDVWGAIDPGHRPPPTFAVLAVGDTRAWKPQWPALWTRLRLRLLHELWRSHAAMQQDGGQHRPAPASAVASRIVLGAAADMRLDWLRASMPAHVLADACGSWMTGGGRPRSLAEARTEFEKLWCANGVLCQLPPAGAPKPIIRWSASWPVPFPAVQPAQ